MTPENTRGKRIIFLAFIVGAILLVPLVAMQFTTEVDWGLEDFVAASVLLFSTGLIYEFGIRKVTDTRRRAILGLMLLFILLYIWAELAVGIFNIPGISGS